MWMMALFVNLSHIDRNIWKSIKNDVKSLVSLTSLSIDSVDIFFIKDKKKFTLHLLTDLLFISSSLNGDGEQPSSIEHLILDNIRINLYHIYSIAPVLRTLDTIIDSYSLNHTKHHFPPEFLAELSIKFFGHFNLSTMKQILHEMTRLVHLTIVVYDMYNDIIDGFAWERILTNIITFKTPFWLDNKHWYVKYDRCTVSGFSLLYSIPYFNNTYPWVHIKGPITTKSTGPDVLSLSNINHLNVNCESPIDTEILCRFTNPQRLEVHYTEKSFYLLIHDIVPDIDISKITTFLIDSCRSTLDADVFVRLLSSMSQLRSFGAPIAFLKLCFVYRWPHISRLRILDSFPSAEATEKQLTLDDINAFYHSFYHIEYVSFSHDTDLNLAKFINNMPPTIFTIVIYHPINVTAATSGGFITRNWLE
ncbi:unnamed protein product [Rotaria socialis]|uniref:Uncharacterized protein n=1 Tax=Rotaria socialis TaxID=392032 RepID=A0A820Y373_9BILA|nr:unnamed protein product [Rotaria socialis]